MKYENKKKVDELCKEIDGLDNLHRSITLSNRIEFKCGQESELTIYFSSENPPNLESLHKDFAVGFKEKVLISLINNINVLKSELNEL
jgi:hypothetical protein